MTRHMLRRAGVALLALALTSGPARAVELVLNPYGGVDWQATHELKANLHTHTTQSDGSLAAARVMAEYHARGYRVLALTDHDKSTWPWAAHGGEATAVEMIPVAGNELSRHHHMLSLFTAYETPERDLLAALDGLAAADGLGVVCHPAMHWPGMFSGAIAVATPLTDALRGLTTGDFTVSAWFRTTDAGRHILLGNYDASRGGSLNLELHTENRVRLYVHPVEGTITDLNVPAAALGIDTRDGQWHHLAGLRRGSRVELYLDGKLAGERADTAGSYQLQGDRYFLGRDHRTGGTTLAGNLDDVGLWSRALTTEEIGRLAAGQAVPEGLLSGYAFETSNGAPVTAGLVADNLDDAQGAHPLTVEAAGALHLVTDVAAPLAASGRSRHALGFGAPGKPTAVPAAAVQFYQDLFLRYPNLVGIEVLNGTRPMPEYALDRELWDRLLTELMPDRPVWGLANDDMHGMTHLGRDWAVFLTPTADEAAVRAALGSGTFYFSSTRLASAAQASPVWTPRLTSVIHDPTAGRLTLRAEVGGQPLPDDAYVWISAGSEVARGPVLDYRTTAGLSRYVRAEITGGGGVSYTNPFGLR